jgi:hypothetical protein
MYVHSVVRGNRTPVPQRQSKFPDIQANKHSRQEVAFNGHGSDAGIHLDITKIVNEVR